MERSLLSRALGPLVALLLGLTIATAGVGFAASLGLIAAKLTTFDKASTIPVSTCTLGAVHDSFVAQEAPTTALQSVLPDILAVQSRSGSRNARTFVRFNIASCIPSGAAVQTASLRLHLDSAPSASRTYQVNRVPATWAENTLTWNNQPGAGAVTDTATTGTTDNVILQWDVLTDVQLFSSGSSTNHGWRVSDQSESSFTTRTGIFTSDEAGTSAPKPQLVVTYYP